MTLEIQRAKMGAVSIFYFSKIQTGGQTAMKRVISLLVVGILFITVDAFAQQDQLNNPNLQNELEVQSVGENELIKETRSDLIEKRLEGLEKTMTNLVDEVMKWRIQEKCETVGCNCKFVTTCTAVSCIKYDERGKCIDQICVATETTLECK